MCKQIIIKLIYLLFPLFLVSCSVEIESSSASSISAILAVLGEYLFAILFLIIFLIIHCLRIVGVAIFTFALYVMFYNIKIVNLDPKIFLILALSLVVISFLPINKIYEPKIIIAKNIQKYKNKKSNIKSRKNYTSIIIDTITGIVGGLILMIIEQNIDFSFVE